MNAITSSDRMLTNDERYAAWSYKYHGAGLHRMTSAELADLACREPSGRATVQQPHSNTQPGVPGKDMQ